jgi:hypothetical protein
MTLLMIKHWWRNIKFAALMNSNRSFKKNLIKVSGRSTTRNNGLKEKVLKFVEYAIIQWVIRIKPNIWSHALILTINWINIINWSKQSIWTTIVMNMPIIWCKNINLILFWCSNFLSFIYKHEYHWKTYSTVLDKVYNHWRGIAIANDKSAYHKHQ